MTDRCETDREDTGACREGDARAGIDAWFVREVLPLEAALKQYLRRNWHDRPDVADLLQETYMRLYEAAGRQALKSAGTTRAFAFATAHNLIVDRLRREKIIPIEAVDDLDALGIAAEVPGPEAHAVARDELRRLQRAVDRLPPRAREAFLLHQIEGLSVREIAVRMAIAERTVVGHLNEGLRTVANILYGETAESRAGQ